MMRLGLILLMTALVATSSGCYTQSAGVFPSSVPLPPDGRYTKTGDVSGDAWAFYILGIPLAEPNPTRQARDRALKNGNVDAIVAGQVDTSLYFFYFFSIIHTQVYGTGARFSS